MSITLESNTNTSTHELIIVRFVPPFVAWQSQPAGLSARKPRCKSFLYCTLHLLPLLHC